MENKVHKKLAEARVRLQKSGIKKTGYNGFSKFYYFQLEDFLPKTNEIFNELGLVSQFFINEGVAYLDIYDVDSDDGWVRFTAPTAEAGIKGASAIQQLGGVITYMRRYLWLMAMEITEYDAVDALPEEKKEVAKKPKKTAPVPISENLKLKVKELYSEAEIAKMLKNRGVEKLDDLSMEDGLTMIEFRSGVASNEETY